MEPPAPQPTAVELVSQSPQDKDSAVGGLDRTVAIAIQELLKQKYGNVSIKFTYLYDQGAMDEKAGYNYNIEIYEVMGKNSKKPDFVAIDDKGNILNNKLYSSQNKLKKP